MKRVQKQAEALAFDFQGAFLHMITTSLRSLTMFNIEIHQHNSKKITENHKHHDMFPLMSKPGLYVVKTSLNYLSDRCVELLRRFFFF